MSFHYTNSKGEKYHVDSLHPSHAKAAANKLEREGGDAELIKNLRESADRREAEFEAANPGYVKKADRPK